MKKLAVSAWFAALLLASPALAGQPKLDVCHVPPGNPGNRTVITVGLPAVAAHLAHGDSIVRAEVCDGLDNDCDGSVDEDFGLGASCTVGVGECAAEGTTVCSSDQTDTVCDAVPGQPSDEICDGLDNDCDGSVDEDFDLGASCSVGVGECAAEGAVVCSSDGGTSCDAVPGEPVDEICGDGLDNDCDGSVDEDCAKFVFVSSQSTSGDLAAFDPVNGTDGLRGGDAICQTLAENAGLSGTWVAWLSTSVVDARDRVADTEYRRLDGVVVASDLADLTDGFLSAPINVDENGATSTAVLAWTGTLGDGTAAAMPHCNDWTDSGSIGLAGGPNASIALMDRWTNFMPLPCVFPAPIYCFEQ